MEATTHGYKITLSLRQGRFPPFELGKSWLYLHNKKLWKITLKGKETVSGIVSLLNNVGEIANSKWKDAKNAVLDSIDYRFDSTTNITRVNEVQEVKIEEADGICFSLNGKSLNAYEHIEYNRSYDGIKYQVKTGRIKYRETTGEPYIQGSLKKIDDETWEQETATLFNSRTQIAEIFVQHNSEFPMQLINWISYTWNMGSWEKKI